MNYNEKTEQALSKTVPVYLFDYTFYAGKVFSNLKN